jgi:hypothetical protein
MYLCTLGSRGEMCWEVRLLHSKLLLEQRIIIASEGLVEESLQPQSSDLLFVGKNCVLLRQRRDST